MNISSTSLGKPPEVLSIAESCSLIFALEELREIETRNFPHVGHPLSSDVSPSDLVVLLSGKVNTFTKVASVYSNKHAKDG